MGQFIVDNIERKELRLKINCVMMLLSYDKRRQCCNFLLQVMIFNKSCYFNKKLNKIGRKT